MGWKLFVAINFPIIEGIFFRKEIPEELELTYQRFFMFWIFLYFLYMLLCYTLADDQQMEVAEKSEVLDANEHYIGEEFARFCRNVMPNPEELKDKEWAGAYLQLRNDTAIWKARKQYFRN